MFVGEKYNKLVILLFVIEWLFNLEMLNDLSMTSFFSRQHIRQTTTSARCHSARSICLHLYSCCSWPCSVALALLQLLTSRWSFPFYIWSCCRSGTFLFI